MSYQVLARKWRPRSFSEMVGQEHVLRALINALDHNRLHHAYLFTGTRGVGKTTVARILAKCLNCETGIGSTPCGVCSTCTEINEGRFVDLIEVDAASRTKVEDTRELLDNVQYLPSSGRFKIYLIDEVHMLSNSSFNALLKTLEEPPEHVKFLLATTDPQKLPATILSRCLQFNLKNMSPEKIVQHLQTILAEEMVPCEEGALWQLARAADGSMRDGLSLTDQAIAFGNGKLAEKDVTSMLGTIDHSFVQKLVEALSEADGGAVLQAVAAFSEHAPDYNAALADLQTLLHRVAIAQALPEALDNSYGDRQAILGLAHKIAPEDVQLFYQTALMGQRDLHLSPVPRTGFEMTLLRMLAFKPQGVVDVPSEPLAAAPVTQSADTAASSHGEPPVKKNQAEGAPQPVLRGEHIAGASSATITQPVSVPVTNVVETAVLAENSPVSRGQSLDHVNGAVVTNTLTEHSELAADTDHGIENEAVAVGSDAANVGEATLSLTTIDSNATRHQPQARHEETRARGDITQAPAPAQTSTTSSVTKYSLQTFRTDCWIDLFNQLQITGVLRMTAANLVCQSTDGDQFVFVREKESGGLLTEEHSKALAEALSEYFGVAIGVQIHSDGIADNIETPAQNKQRLIQERREEALEDLLADPVVKRLQRDFDAKLDAKSLIIQD